MAREQSDGYLARSTPRSLADVLEIVLDKGVVIDAYARVSLLGIELVTLDARIVVSSVDTYLRFAETANRLDLVDKGGTNLADALSGEAGTVIEDVASRVAERKVDDVMGTVGDTLGGPAEKVARSAAGKIVGVAETVTAKATDVTEETERG